MQLITVNYVLSQSDGVVKCSIVPASAAATVHKAIYNCIPKGFRQKFIFVNLPSNFYLKFNETQAKFFVAFG